MSSSNTFQSQIENPTSPIVNDFSSLSNTMLLAFGGMKGELGIPAFEFFNLTSHYDTKKIYCRDLQQAWYHRGLPGVAETIDGTAIKLKRTIEQYKISRIIAIGNSMGGYAALLFGCLLDMSEVHAFCPQTFIGRIHRFIHRDTRWQEQIRDIYQARNSQREYYDLKKVLKFRKCENTTFHIHFNRLNRLDTIHAVRMKSLSNIVLHPYDVGGGGHDLVRHLRDDALLKDIILKSLEGR